MKELIKRSGGKKILKQIVRNEALKMNFNIFKLKVDGVAKPGQLLAIMGASGAGNDLRNYKFLGTNFC